MSSNKISAKKILATTEVVTFLENIAAGMKTGQVMVECGNDAVMMRIPTEVKLEIEVKQSRDKNRITLELAWEREPAEDSDSLKIRPGANARM